MAAHETTPIWEKGGITQFGAALGAGAGTGMLFGAAKAAWEQAPATQGMKSTAAVQTLAKMRYYGFGFGAVAGTVIAAERMAATARGREDSWNSAFGGAAGGLLFAIPSKSAKFGLGCAAGLAAVLALVEVNDKKMQQRSDYTNHKLFGHRGAEAGHH